MMNFKKTMAMILAVTTLLTTIPVSTVFAAEDTTAPVINTITVVDSTTEYGIGDTLNLSFDITEEETGISSAYVTFYSAEEVASFSVYADLSENDLTGTYYGSYTIPEGTRSGEWTSVSAYAVDKVGNEYSEMLNNSISITINNPDEGDKTAPTITDRKVRYDTVSLDDTQYVEFNSSDKDLSYALFRVGCLDGGQGRNITYNLTVNDEGKYEIPFTFTSSDFTGNWVVAYMYVYDINGNHTDFFGDPISFTVTSGETNKEEEHDTTDPTVTSVTTDKTEVVTPGYVNITISGTENVIGSTVSVTAAIGNDNVVNGTRYVNGTATVTEDGTWSTTMEYSFSKDTVVSDKWELYYVKVVDSNSNRCEEYKTFVTFNVKSSNGNVTKEVSLSSPKVVDSINSIPDNSTILVNTDKSVVPSDVFSAIQGTNKTLVFNLNGIQWIFKGSDITNPKDVDLTMSLEEIDAEEYGYEEGTNAVRLNFAPNGILPGKATIRIKSDYISKLYNLSSELYLAFIKDTAEVEEEISYTDYEWPEDEDGNPIYYTTTYLYDENGSPLYYMSNEENKLEEVEYVSDEDYEALLNEYASLATDENQQLYYTESVEPEEVERIETINKTVTTYTRIEDAGITIDNNGYISIELTHNSSYILCSSLPVVKASSNEENNTNNKVGNIENSNNSTNNSNDSKSNESQKVSNNTNNNSTSNSSSNTASTNKKTSNATSKKINKYTKVSGSSKSIKVGYTSNKKYKGFQIKISTNKSMKNSKTYAGKSSKSIKGLKTNKKYYCRIRFYKTVNGKKTYTSWKSFTVHTA